MSDRRDERLRGGWLVSIGLLGACLIAGAVVLDMVARREDIIPAVLLNAGTGVLLFAVLFYAERRLVVRTTARLVTAIEWTEEQIRDLTSKRPDELADPEALTAAQDIVQTLVDGRYEDAWTRAHPAWRLARIQAWLWNNRDSFGHDVRELDHLATDLSEHEAESPHWESFIETERRQFAEAWSHIDFDSYGFATAKRRRGPGYEIVHIAPLHDHPDGFVVNQPTAIYGGLRLLMYRSEGEWQLASHVGEALPSPGWPPAWWADDPALSVWEREQSFKREPQA